MIWQNTSGILGMYDVVSIEDLDFFVGRWMMENCTSGNNYCGGGDLDSSGTVDLADYAILAGHWLEGM